MTFRKLWQYQSWGKPVPQPGGEPETIYFEAWQQPQSQPERNYLMRRLQAIALVAIPFFFFQEQPVAAAFTDQPFDAVSQPLYAAKRPATLGPHFFFQEEPAAAVFTDQPIEQIQMPQRWRMPRVHYDAIVAPVLVPGGITQPSGAGTTIFIYDNTLAADGLAYHFAEISTAFPADFIDNGTTPKSYRSKVSLQIGDTSAGTAATTLSDTAVGVYFDAAKGLLWRASSTSSWTTNFGTKIGSGDKASGVDGVTIRNGLTTPWTIRGNISWYDSTIITAGTVAINQGASGLTGDIQACILGITGTANVFFGIGTASFQFNNLYRVSLWGKNAVASAGLLGISNFATAERLSIAGPSMSYFIRNTSTSQYTLKDVTFFGTPAIADAVSTVAGASWDLVRPGWSGAAKFPNVLNTAAGTIREDWLFNVRVVDRLGAAIASIPVKLTDTLGNVQVNTTTDANGQVAFGTGLLLNAVVVRDHYGDGVTYSTRDRSPFTVAVNTGASENSAYLSRTYDFNWPLTETGAFQDVNDVVALQDPSGGPTAWVEASIS